MPIFRLLEQLHNFVFSTFQRLAGSWFLGLASRLVFSSALFMYFINSARTKVGEGFPDFLIPGDGAYVQIFPSVMDAVGYDTDAIAFIPYGLIVYLGTYAEFILPVLILIGLLTRAASLIMLGFIIVMSYVDIVFHKVGAETIGALFDRFQDSAISDQRLLWASPLIYLILKGAGSISLDRLLGGKKTIGGREFS